jgi:hypothetical protein
MLLSKLYLQTPPPPNSKIFQNPKKSQNPKSKIFQNPKFSKILNFPKFSKIFQNFPKSKTSPFNSEERRRGGEKAEQQRQQEHGMSRF